jgi:outer membrane protein TolC
MPMEGAHTLTVMVGAPLPWLWGGRQAAAVAASRELEAERRAREAAHLLARYQLREAQARLDAAREQFDILDGELEPQARRGAEEAQAEFITGQGEAVAALEALHALLTVRLQRSRALQQLEEAEADLDLAAGLPYPSTPGASP